MRRKDGTLGLLLVSRYKSYMNIVKRLLLTIALLISAGKVLAEEAKPVEKSSQNFIAVVDLHYILENSQIGRAHV